MHQIRDCGKVQSIGGTAEVVAASRSSQDWQRLMAASGSEGPRLHDWCYVELPDLAEGGHGSDEYEVRTSGSLICRHIVDGAVAFFSS